MTRWGHEATERSRSGAGDETTGSHVTSDGEADHLGIKQPRSVPVMAQRYWRILVGLGNERRYQPVLTAANQCEDRMAQKY